MKPKWSGKKKLLIVALGVIIALALINPRYGLAMVDGPNGLVKSEKFSFGPGSFINFTRIVADGDRVEIEQKQ